MRNKTIDWSFIIIPLVLAVISTATIYTITFVSVGNKLAVSQAIYLMVGFVLLGLFSIFDYRQLKGLAPILYASGILLLLPLITPLAHKLPLVICEFNACRWINLGIFRFQTSELFKLITIIILGAIVSERVGKLKPIHFVLCIGLLLAPALLILEQPDLGTAMVIILTGIILLWLVRFPIWLWGVVIIVGLIVAPIGWHHLKPYQKNRIAVFINPNLDPSRTGYNVRQAEIAVGSGGVFGRGFGRGSQSQLNFLPVAHTDFIFAGYAEATGFLGSAFLLGLFAVLVWRAIHVAELAKDHFGQFLALGIATMLAIQIFINIGMNIRLMPVTGVPLPLVSFGGTAIFVDMIALGLLQSIVIRHKKISFT